MLYSDAVEHLPACEYDPDTLVLLIFPLSSLHIAFAVFDQYLLSTSHISLFDDTLVRIRYGIRISTLYALIFLFPHVKNLLMFFSNAVAKPFTILHQLVFSFSKASIPPKVPYKIGVEDRIAAIRNWIIGAKKVEKALMLHFPPSFASGR